MSTESISTSHAVGDAEPCARCGAPLDEDQRYCLECGERRAPMSSVLLGGPPSPDGLRPAGAVAPSPSPAPAAGAAGRGNGVTVIAGVGVLLLAMGVGVLIGRSGGSKQSALPAQVITVGSTPAGSAPGGSAEASSFTDDWPAGTSGYTVQLQRLPAASTPVSAVEAAKASASAKGAKGVGALKSEDFSSLAAGNYVIYSGVYHKRAEAEKALPGLKRRFPGASVVKVASGPSKSSSGGGGASSSGGSGSGASESHPAPPSVVESLKSVKGKNYEEKSKNLPNVISTG